jgi:hypothetical protein
MEHTLAEKTIPIDKLVLDDGAYPRVFEDYQDVCRFRDAMQAGEVMPPPVVVPMENGEAFIVVDGWRRILAAKELKRKTMLCRVDTETGRDARSLKALSTFYNCRHGKNLSMYERMLVAKELLDARWPLGNIAKCLAMPVPSLKKYMSERVTEFGVLKSAMTGSLDHERAISHQGHVQATDLLSILDQFIAMWRAGEVQRQARENPLVAARVAKIVSYFSGGNGNGNEEEAARTQSGRSRKGNARTTASRGAKVSGRSASAHRR